MIRKVKEFTLNNNLIDIQYVVPNEFKLSKPSYHSSTGELLGDKRHYYGASLPTVIYAVAKNSDGEVLNAKYDDDAIFTWNLKNYNPGFFSPASEDENSHYFNQYLNSSHFNFNKAFNAFIEKSKKKGFDDIYLSVGIWTDEGILNERIIPFSDDIAELSAQYHLLSKELNELYLNSPDVILHNYSTVFTDPNMLMADDTKIEVGEYILSSMMSKEFKDGFRLNKEINLLSGSQFVLVSKLNTSTPKILETTATLSLPDGTEVSLSFDNFTVFLCNVIGKSDNGQVLDIEGNVLDISKLPKETTISTYHKFTDYLKRLREIKFS